jgi:hypothetical protein
MRLIPRLVAAFLAAVMGVGLAACGGRAEPSGNVAIRNLGPSQMHFVVVKTPDQSYTLGDISPKTLKAVQVTNPAALYVDFQDDHGRSFTYTLDHSRLDHGGRLEVQVRENRIINGSAW